MLPLVTAVSPSTVAAGLGTIVVGTVMGADVGTVMGADVGICGAGVGCNA